MKRSVLLLMLCVVAGAAPAQMVTGRVFDETSNKGIAGVVVSDQAIATTTDASGNFQINVTPGRMFVMITMPDGFKGTYYRKVESNTKIDFPLKVDKAVTEFSFIHASDTHISKESENRTEKLRALAEKIKPNFVIVTGDLIKDALRVPEETASSLYKLYVDNIAKFTTTRVYSVPGNHEIFGIERQTSLVSPKNEFYAKKMYAHYLGPNYYSFNYGGIHFVGLDDVDYEDMWYYGHVDSLQTAWLKADLAATPKNMPVVTFHHMPMFSGGLSVAPFEDFGPGRSLERVKGELQYRHVVSNTHELLPILQSHPYPLSLAGHHHARQVFRYESTGQNTRFEQTGAVVGNGGEGNIIMKSGVVLYKVKNGVIDEGTFIPLD